jgi:hypothetical protein
MVIPGQFMYREVMQVYPKCITLHNFPINQASEFSSTVQAQDFEEQVQQEWNGIPKTYHC